MGFKQNRKLVTALSALSDNLSKYMLNIILSSRYGKLNFVIAASHIRNVQFVSN